MTASEKMMKIERKILLRVPRQRAWRALTSVAEFSKWFSVKTAATEFKPGIRIDMTSTSETCSGGDFHFVVEEMTPMKTFSWRWHPGAPQPGFDYTTEPTTLVEFHLEEVEDGTLVTVVETGFDRISLARRAKVFGDNDHGWESQMNALQQYAGSAA